MHERATIRRGPGGPGCLALALLCAVACAPAASGGAAPQACADLRGPPQDLRPLRCAGHADCPQTPNQEGAIYSWLCCDGACFDPYNDPQHCGTCETRCEEGRLCRGLRCD